MQQGISQVELAGKIGVNEMTIMSWEIKGMVPCIKNSREKLIQEVEGAGRFEECLTDDIQQRKELFNLVNPVPQSFQSQYFRSCHLHQFTDTRDKILPVLVVKEYRPAFDSPHYHMVKYPRCGM